MPRGALLGTSLAPGHGAARSQPTPREAARAREQGRRWRGRPARVPTPPGHCAMPLPPSIRVRAGRPGAVRRRPLPRRGSRAGTALWSGGERTLGAAAAALHSRWQAARVHCAATPAPAARDDRAAAAAAGRVGSGSGRAVKRCSGHGGLPGPCSAQNSAESSYERPPVGLPAAGLRAVRCGARRDGYNAGRPANVGPRRAWSRLKPHEWS